MLFLYSCSSQPYVKKVLGDFDISPNDSIVVYAYNSGNGFSIYSIGTDGCNKNDIAIASENIGYFNPKFSLKGDKLLFISYENNDLKNCALCVANINGSSLKKITEGNEIITEAVFANNDSAIIYCKANKYERNSPLVNTHASNFDLYLLNLFTDSIKKISELNAYGIYGVEPYKYSEYLLHIYAGNNGGMFVFNSSNPHKIERIVPVNNPRNDSSMYYMPKYSKNNDLLVFVAPYEIYIMNMIDKEAGLLFDNKGNTHINDVDFYNSGNKILFTMSNRTDFFSINIDGSGFTELGR